MDMSHTPLFASDSWRALQVLGLTLLGLARGSDVSIYTHPELFRLED